MQLPMPTSVAPLLGDDARQRGDGLAGGQEVVDDQDAIGGREELRGDDQADQCALGVRRRLFFEDLRSGMVMGRTLRA